MLHVRLSEISSVSFGLAGGAALLGLPMPLGIMAGGAMALASWTMLALRETAPRVASRRHNRLAPFESARELVREPDAAPAAANTNLTPYQAGRSDFRLAPVTDHVFRRGDRVDFIFDSWDAGELLFHGTVAETFKSGCKVLVGDDTYHVDRECLVLVEAAQ